MSALSTSYVPIDGVDRFALNTNSNEQEFANLPTRRDASPHPIVRQSSKPNTYGCCGHISFILAYVVLALSMLSGFIILKNENDVKFRQLNQIIEQLQNELHNSEQSSVVDYKNVLNQLSNMSLHEISFENSTALTLGNHQFMLTRLSNGTSNADVLDKMRETADSINSQLLLAQSEIQSTMASATRNVSIQLQKSTAAMQQTQNDVDSRLNVTFSKMENVVSVAAANILGVQQNVSTQLTTMRASLGVTVDDLNLQVQSAQGVIRDEVAAVKANIDQYVVVTNQQFAAENDFVKYQLAGTFTLLGCLISMWHLTSHLRHYYKPDVQRRVMAVLWMVPIYSITSWLSLVLPSAEPVLGALRDCYEAYVIYTFIALLVAILEDGKGVKALIGRLSMHVVEEREFAAQALLANPRAARPKEHIKPPFACCYVTHRPSSVASAWLYQCKLMAMQFVMLKPLLTIVPLIITLSGYHLDALPLVVNNAPNWRSPQLYILFMQNLSVGVAFWGLLSFYHGAEKDLAWCDPWPKFLCIKGVVFATFWQALTIQFMSSAGFVDPRTGSQIQNLLICIEMLLASLAHFYIFPYQEWADDYKREREKGLMLRDTLALRDFVKDMRDMVTTWDPHEAGASDAHGSSGGQLTEESQGLLASEDEEAGEREESPDLESGDASGYFQLVDSPARLTNSSYVRPNTSPPSSSSSSVRDKFLQQDGSSRTVHSALQSPAQRELEMLLRSDSDAVRAHYSATNSSHVSSAEKRGAMSSSSHKEAASALMDRAQRELLAKLELLEPARAATAHETNGSLATQLMQKTGEVEDPVNSGVQQLRVRRSLSYSSSSDSSGSSSGEPEKTAISLRELSNVNRGGEGEGGDYEVLLLRAVDSSGELSSTDSGQLVQSPLHNNDDPEGWLSTMEPPHTHVDETDYEAV